APYTVEAKAFADYLKENKPNAKVGMLKQADDFGQAYEEGFRKEIEGTDIKIVQVKTYKPGDSEVTSQVTSLANSAADTFLNGATLLACPNALTGAKQAQWDAPTYVSGSCISKTLMSIAGDAADGILAVTNLQAPQNPKWAENQEMKDYFSTL